MIVNLNDEQFCEKVYNYKMPGDLTFKGLIPSVILFYAAGNYCSGMLKLLDEISTEYDGKMAFYSIDVNAENKLAYEFGIRAIPTLILIPLDKNPFIVTGLSEEKAMLEKLIVQIPFPQQPKSNIILAK